MKIALITSFMLLVSISATASQQHKYTNKLVNESSPYLLQHAHNPVNWYPWGEEAFAKARREDKPIFLSIGYSTCHWCHVMERESFENPAVAKLLNEVFVSIKVDREERPDIDRIYITASEIMNGHAGWPTSVFAMPDLKPFFAGTYIPPNTTNGQTGLSELTTQVKNLWDNQRSEVISVANDITEVLKKQLVEHTDEGKLDKDIADKTYLAYKQIYDNEFGGFGNAPKFPRIPQLDFLYQYGKQNPRSNAHHMLTNTLLNMSHGGIYDHVGGGFHRYSVDAEWQIPHFEKMLYDQALLISSLLDAVSIEPADIFIKRINKSIKFTLEHMQHKDGGFYSAYDADSSKPGKPQEHSEGAYYSWHKSQLDKLLNSEEQKVFYAYFNIQQHGNVISDPQNEFTNLNILYASPDIEQHSNQLKMKPGHFNEILRKSLRKLEHERARRTPPHLDDKIITSWNSLMITALAKAGKQLHNKAYIQTAIRSAEFIKQNLYDKNTSHLYRSYRDQKLSGRAFLDDYAYFIQALLELYRATEDQQWLSFATHLTSQQIELFWDEQHGGFYDSSDEDQNLLFRSKEIYDGVLPSANGIAAMNFIKLAKLTRNKQWLTYANKTINLFHERINEVPDNYPQIINAYMQLKK